MTEKAESAASPEAAQSPQGQRRNDVFTSGTSGAPPVPQSMQAGQQPGSEFGFEVAIDSVPLASRGLTYPESSPLHMKDSVDIRAMTAKEEDILTSRAYMKNGTMVTRLLEACLVDKRIDAGGMLSGDRQAIMVAIRITGYGREYPVEVQCPDCDEKSDFTFDLASLPVTRLELQPVRPGENLFEYTMPKSGAKILWKFMTGRDEEELTQVESARKKAKMQQDNLITARMTRMIVSINGIDDRNKISRGVTHIPAADSNAFREYIRGHEPGIEMKGDFSCSSCGESSEVEVPLTAGFFWPGANRS